MVRLRRPRKRLQLVQADATSEIDRRRRRRAEFARRRQHPRLPGSGHRRDRIGALPAPGPSGTLPVHLASDRSALPRAIANAATRTPIMRPAATSAGYSMPPVRPPASPLRPWRRTFRRAQETDSQEPRPQSLPQRHAATATMSCEVRRAPLRRSRPNGSPRRSSAPQPPRHHRWPFGTARDGAPTSAR